ncbi:MAG: aminotransferase class V-fold PLP-dependent enzyme, partial [Caldisericales bacterium]|nr:aminotransferase class V-fold PLP-dependent enzyme [Caldisericales bacterium]
FAACDVLGRIDLEDFERKARGARVAAFVAASNVTGAIQPIRELAGICSQNGVISVVDAAQLAPHQRIDFDSLGVDFMAIAGHKMMASKGAGLLLAKESAQPLIRPLIVGGGSIKDVATDSFELLPFPEGFESGTPSIEGILSLWKAIEWLQEQGENDVWLHEGTLNRQARDAISQVRGLKIYQPENSTPTMSVELSGWEPNKLAIKLDREFNIAVRSGHMCALPLVRDTMGFPKGLCRISFGPWNEMEDVFSIAGALDKISREKTCW